MISLELYIRSAYLASSYIQYVRLSCYPICMQQQLSNDLHEIGVVTVKHTPHVGLSVRSDILDIEHLHSSQ